MLEFIFRKIFQEIIGFFRGWYIGGTARFWSLALSFLAVLDQQFAVVINLKLINKPLYGDYSAVGRVIGPIFRLFRILLGSTIYLLIFILALLIWLVWVLVLPVAVFLIISQWGT
ncbi:MAG: hypothetical protein AB1721_01735 [Patescibacteria group bacterium]